MMIITVNRNEFTKQAQAVVDVKAMKHRYKLIHPPAKFWSVCAYSGKPNGTNNARLNKFKRAVTQIQGKRCHKTVLELSIWLAVNKTTIINSNTMYV